VLVQFHYKRLVIVRVHYKTAIAFDDLLDHEHHLRVRTMVTATNRRELGQISGFGRVECFGELLSFTLERNNRVHLRMPAPVRGGGTAS
jgi:hypothetical protein